MSGAPINLNKARKARARADDKARAKENVQKHGRSKAVRSLDAARAAKAAALLDAHRKDGQDGADD